MSLGSRNTTNYGTHSPAASVPAATLAAGQPRRSRPPARPAKQRTGPPQYAFPPTINEMTSQDFQLDVNAHIEVVADLLKDKVYFGHFQTAILKNQHLFRDRVVLDVGCGIGILSLFAARAGARRVYAVDSSNVVDYLGRIVADNGFNHVIRVIKGRVEEIELPVKAVDIIVCNWLGYSLLFESLCDAVIFARDKWLKRSTGLIFPDAAKLFLAAVEDSKHKNERIDWWKDVYGFQMDCIRKFALSEPIHLMVRPQQVLSTSFCIKTLNLYTATLADLKFRSKYLLKINRSGCMHGVVTYLHVCFSKSHTPFAFSTGPSSPRTHLLQTVYFFDQPIAVNEDQVFYGGIEMCSASGRCNLKNMQVGFEMFSGDPLDMQLETEMRWILKPHALVLDTTATSKACDGTSSEQSHTRILKV